MVDFGISVNLLVLPALMNNPVSGGYLLTSGGLHLHADVLITLTHRHDEQLAGENPGVL